MVKEVLIRGAIDENCYFLIEHKTRHGWVIDPGGEAEKLLSLIKSEGWSIERILLTHGHFDHIGAAEQLRDVLGIPVLAHKNASEYLLKPGNNLSVYYGREIIVDDAQPLEDGDVIRLDADPAFSLKVIYTPGHTTDGVIYYSEGEGVAFTGDTIFKGSIGNDRFPGGNLQTLQSSIIRRVFTLPEETLLYSGHSEVTTVGEEKRRWGF